MEVLSNNFKDFGLKKALDNLETVRQTLATVTDRFAQFEAQALDVHVDFPLFQRLALPIPSGNTKIPGIKIHDARMLRLMEVLLHRGTQMGDGAPAKSTKPCSPPFHSAPKPTPSPNSVMTCANSKPMAYSSATATAMLTA